MDVLTTAADPLAGYEHARSVVFASPGGTLLTRGALATVTGELRELAGRRPPERGLVAGAIAFDGAAHLIRPAAASWSAPLSPAPPPPPSGRWWTRPFPMPSAYTRSVRQALDAMEAGELAKVVLARTLDLRSDEPVDPAEVVRPLLGHGYAFAAPLPGGRVLAGASPELLVSRRGRTVLSNPLAGSALRDPDPATDAARAADLLESAKDLREHRLVVESVAERLLPYCDELNVPERPELTSTATMWHLSTRVTGRLRDQDTGSVTLAAALHPTPAVCGSPEPEARRLISALEPFDRGFYGGLVGWCDASGDGEWAVAIRCAELDEHTVRLYAGAGIVPGSVPERELAETAGKFRTMLGALGAWSDALD